MIYNKGDKTQLRVMRNVKTFKQKRLNIQIKIDQARSNSFLIYLIKNPNYVI